MTPSLLELLIAAKNQINENDLRAMKRILYDMGLLTLVGWLLQRAFKFEPHFGRGSELKRVPPPKKKLS